MRALSYELQILQSELWLCMWVLELGALSYYCREYQDLGYDSIRL